MALGWQDCIWWVLAKPVFKCLLEDHASQMSRIGKRFDQLYPSEVRQLAKVCI